MAAHPRSHPPTTTADGPSAEAIRRLSADARGRLVLPDDGDYDAVRSVWNGTVDKRPAAVLLAEGVDDVVAGVEAARRHGLPLAVHGGGHNVAGFAVSDGGLTIHLGALRSTHVDPARARVRVGGGATLADVDAATLAHGLAMATGAVSTTGIGGLALGGGFGWLSRAFALAADALISAEVVLATGEVVRAGPDEHADLFWALRGGGGNFGVVTEFEFALQPLGPEIFTGVLVHPFDEAAAYLRAYREHAEASPDELTTYVILRRAPPLPFLAERHHGELVAITAFAFVGGQADGERQVRALREAGTPLAVHTGMVPYTAWQQGFDPSYAAGARNFWKSHYLGELSDGAIDAYLEAATTLPSAECELVFAQLGGAIARVPTDATAYAHRAARFAAHTHARWTDPGDDERHVAWARELFGRTKRFSMGAYVNYLDADDGGRTADAYPEAVFERLRAVKGRYDPENLFRSNQNVPPA